MPGSVATGAHNPLPLRSSDATFLFRRNRPPPCASPSRTACTPTPSPNFGPNGVRWPSEPESLGSDGGGPSALIVRSRTKVTADVLASFRLKVVGRAGVGVDNIDLEAATAAGVRVVNAPRASTHSVVELTMAHLLGSVRFLGPSDRAMREGRWIKKEAKGTELSGKRLGLVGYGRIARGVAAVAVALGMEVHAYDPYLPEDVDIAPATTLHGDLDDLFRSCTHISLHCGLTPETHHMVDARRLNLMPQTGADGVAAGPFGQLCTRWSG